MSLNAIVMDRIMKTTHFLRNSFTTMVTTVYERKFCFPKAICFVSKRPQNELMIQMYSVDRERNNRIFVYVCEWCTRLFSYFCNSETNQYLLTRDGHEFSTEITETYPKTTHVVLGHRKQCSPPPPASWLAHFFFVPESGSNSPMPTAAIRPLSFFFRSSHFRSLAVLSGSQ